MGKTQSDRSGGEQLQEQVRLVSEQERTDRPIYGRTGIGKAEGIVVDAWLTGFAEGTEGKIYVCVHLGRTNGKYLYPARISDIIKIDSSSRCLM